LKAVKEFKEISNVKVSKRRRSQKLFALFTVGTSWLSHRYLFNGWDFEDVRDLS